MRIELQSDKGGLYRATDQVSPTQEGIKFFLNYNFCSVYFDLMFSSNSILLQSYQSEKIIDIKV